MDSLLYDQNSSIDIIKIPDTVLITKIDHPLTITTMEDIDIINDEKHRSDYPLSNATRKQTILIIFLSKFEI